MDQKRFEEAKRKIIGVDRQRLGIGTLSEKTVHAIFKDYYEPDEDHQEIPIENYVADIYRDGEIIEIQTRQFNRMRGKLQTFLPLYPVTIVYPIPYEKWLIWIDEDSGELSKKRKSPKKGCTYQAFKELYKIKMFLKDPNIRFKFILVNMEEYRLLNVWSHDKKRAPHGMTGFQRIWSKRWKSDNRRIICNLCPMSWKNLFTVKILQKPPTSLSHWLRPY